MTHKLLVLLLIGSLSAVAQQQTITPTKPAESAATIPQVQPAPAPEASAPPCLIVKHKGTIGRRLMWTALIGVPIAPGAKFDYVDNINVPKVKMAYKGKELEKLQADGTRVIVLENKHTSEDVAAARNSCHESKPVEQTTKK